MDLNVLKKNLEDMLALMGQQDEMRVDIDNKDEGGLWLRLHDEFNMCYNLIKVHISQDGVGGLGLFNMCYNLGRIIHLPILFY